jgi:hypothetical protein
VCRGRVATHAESCLARLHSHRGVSANSISAERPGGLFSEEAAGSLITLDYVFIIDLRYSRETQNPPILKTECKTFRRICPIFLTKCLRHGMSDPSCCIAGYPLKCL